MIQKIDKKKKEFFKKAPEVGIKETFDDLNLSRPLQKAINELGYRIPTPIQAKTIPIAMMGHDICGSAVTGSGKTAAFVLPILERLLHRDRRIAATRIIILSPTRELAVQTHSVVQTLSKHTDIRTVLVVGGLSNKAQEAQLRTFPDIIVATPGRMIDHIRNAHSITLDTVEILILDEADRLLDEGFKDELQQIIKYCPTARQTILFSATMTEDVDRLISVTLNNPVRISVDNKNEVCKRLSQEFIRIKQNHELDKEAILLAICSRSFKSQVIIFCAQKKTAHRIKLIFGLTDLKASELHGNLSQTQRLEALDKFKNKEIDFLIATDLAARGLDIIGIQTVVNYDMPTQLEPYLHRVGRTARAGASGKAVSFITDDSRKLLKKILKTSKEKMQNRVIPIDILENNRNKIEGMEDNIKQIILEEHEDREIRIAERDAAKAQNLVEHADEIKRRPQRTWFQSETQKN